MDMRVVCRLCGGEARELFRLPHSKVYECTRPRCGLRFSSPQLGDLELSEAYRDSYYPGENESGHDVYEPTSAGVLTQVLEALPAEIGNVRGRRLLDFGCGPGGLSRLALNLGLRPTGVEFDPVARKSANERTGIRVYSDLDALEREERDASFDLVALWEVIEHLREPWLELSRIRRRMGLAGTLFLSTPNAACLKARAQRARWANYANPTHFYYFTRRSLRLTLERAGFTRVREWLLPIQYPGHGLLRSETHRWLFRMGLHGALLFLAENPAASTTVDRRSCCCPDNLECESC